MIRFLFRLLGLANTTKIVSSGDPNRIGKHVVRKTAHKVLAKMLRGL